MEIGETEIAILKSKPLLSLDDWKKIKSELGKDLIYVERVLVANSNSGNPTYYKYKFIQDGTYIDWLDIHGVKCILAYGDVWAHDFPGGKFTHAREYYPKKSQEEFIMYPPRHNFSDTLVGGYGGKFTAVQVADRESNLCDVLIEDILDIEIFLSELSFHSNWREYFTAEFYSYFTQTLKEKIESKMFLAFDYINDPAELIGPLFENNLTHSERRLAFLNNEISEISEKYESLRMKYKDAFSGGKAFIEGEKSIEYLIRTNRNLSNGITRNIIKK